MGNLKSIASSLPELPDLPDIPELPEIPMAINDADDSNDVDNVDDADDIDNVDNIDDIIFTITDLFDAIEEGSYDDVIAIMELNVLQLEDIFLSHNICGNFIIHSAVKSQCPKIVKWALDLGMHANMIDLNEQVPLDYAITISDSSEITNLLIKYGALCDIDFTRYESKNINQDSKNAIIEKYTEYYVSRTQNINVQFYYKISKRYAKTLYFRFLNQRDQDTLMISGFCPVSKLMNIPMLKHLHYCKKRDQLFFIYLNGASAKNTKDSTSEYNLCLYCQTDTSVKLRYCKTCTQSYCSSVLCLRCSKQNHIQKDCKRLKSKYEIVDIDDKSWLDSYVA